MLHRQTQIFLYFTPLDRVCDTVVWKTVIFHIVSPAWYEGRCVSCILKDSANQKKLSHEWIAFVTPRELSPCPLPGVQTCCFYSSAFGVSFGFRVLGLGMKTDPLQKYLPQPWGMPRGHGQRQLCEAGGGGWWGRQVVPSGYTQLLLWDLQNKMRENLCFHTACNSKQIGRQYTSTTASMLLVSSISRL